jgi:hypothetical protein
VITVPNKSMALEFFRVKYGMRGSEDFRGTLFVPDNMRGAVISMDHVGVAYAWDNFVGRTCCISIIVQKPECLTRPVIREAFRFPFDDCGCTAIYALVDSTNEKSLSLCHRVGFKPVHRTRDGGRHGDLIVFEMLREECRWLKRSH